MTLLGSGSAMPGKAVSSTELAAHLAKHCGARFSSRALKYANRLGIRSRHVSRDLTSPMSGTLPEYSAPRLCQQALLQASRKSTITYMIGHTATPHTLLPPNVAWVAESMRYDGPYVELRQACTGFASALSIAAAMISENENETVAIVGSENGSPFFDLFSEFATNEQLINYVQMGDGAGAAILSADDGSQRHLISDVYSGQIGADMSPGISLEGGGSANPHCPSGLPYFRHNARQVRKNGESLIRRGIDAIESRGYSLADFDWILPHQVNGHVGEIFAARFPECEGKVVVIADQLGNLGSAAIWVGLDKLRRSGRLLPGHRVLVLGAEASKYLYGGFVYTH